MRIPLKVHFFAGGLRAMAQILIRSEEPHIFLSVNAIVDTGSPATILGVPDLKRARVSPIALRNLTSRVSPIQYGGGEVSTKILQDANLKFQEHYECQMPIQIPVKTEGDCTQPTILGVDFMLANNFNFFFDPIKQIAYFESSEDETKETS